MALIHKFRGYRTLLSDVVLYLVKKALQKSQALRLLFCYNEINLKGQKEMKLNKTELSWILYDVANSAFILIVTATIPIYFRALATQKETKIGLFSCTCRTP